MLRLENSIWGLVTCALSGLVLLSLFSYSPADEKALEVGNLIGPFGAAISHLLLEAIGLGSFLLIAGAFWVGIAIMRHGTWHLKRRQAIGGGLFVVGFLYLAHMAVGYSLDWPDGAGGFIGSLLCELTSAVMGDAGTAVLATLFTVAGISLFSARTPQSLAASAGRSFANAAADLWDFYLDARDRFASGPQDEAAPVEKTRDSRPVYETSGLAIPRDVPQNIPREPTKAVRAPTLYEHSSPEALTLPRRDPSRADSDWRQDLEVEVELEDASAEGTTTAAARAMLSVPILAEPPDYLKDDSDLATGGEEPPPVPRPKLHVLEKKDFQLPSLELLDYHPPMQATLDKDALMGAAQKLTQKLADLKVSGEVEGIHPGPVVSLFEFKPGRAVKVSQIANLSKDLALALAAEQVRVIAPIPGRDVVGIEVPNRDREPVYLRELLSNKTFAEGRNALPVVLGKDISGKPRIADLTKMPHLLIAGTTGSGKSVAMHSYLLSILYKLTPEQVRFILVDPKMLELTAYNDIPHLLHPVVTSAKDAAVALRWLVGEMERRNRLMSSMGVPNIAEYNQILEAGPGAVLKAKASRMRLGADGIRRDESLDLDEPKPLPYIVLVIDELADLMMVSGKQVETYIARLAQMARAGGIHMIIATQNPTTKVVTGIIKANMPSRIAFKVRSMQDSRVVLDQNGADDLLGYGDMLFLPPGSSKLNRIHGAMVSTEERMRVVEFLRSQGEPEYNHEIMAAAEAAEAEYGSDDYDPNRHGSEDLYTDAVCLARTWGRVSTSKLQQELGIGYNKAARIMTQMEKEGLVGPQEGAGKPRVFLG
jgi:S-DNA-T family DNA segregation ATPase FtsK/SpoIIIE